MFNNLVAEQARHKMTNENVAEKLGISRVSYESKKKSGRFTVSECWALCSLFKCSFEYLFSIDSPTVDKPAQQMPI